MEWKEKARQLLTESLHPIPAELNELDWKSGLSEKTDRLAQHLSAFANLQGGGILVFGVNNDGNVFDMSKQEIDEIVQKLGNIAQNNLAYPIQIEHAVMDYEGKSILFIHIPEQSDKPVFLRGKDLFSSYHRSAGQTVKMSKSQVKAMIASSEGVSFEKQIAMKNLKLEEVLSLLNYKALFEILDKDVPSSTDSIINRLKEFKLYEQIENLWNITNLGAILFAKDLKTFANMQLNKCALLLFNCLQRT